MALLIPWPLKRQRTASVEAARRQKEASLHSAAHAAVIEREIEQLAAENHFAALIAAHIMRGYRQEGS